MSYFTQLLQATCLLLILGERGSVLGSENARGIKDATVSVVLLARNKEHVLPYFLTLFERLNYSKDRMALYIRSDHNRDRTIPILEDWLAHNRHLYHYVDAKLDYNGPEGYKGDKEGSEWGRERFTNLMMLKEEAFHRARNMWCDYVWFLDVDVLLTNRDTLQGLVNEGKAVVAPMLNSLATYSNYWGGMTDDLWYTRSEDYIPILDRKQRGCFSVPMIHSCVLVDLTMTASDNLTFTPKKLPGYEGPHDDIIVFAIAAKRAGLEMHVCNDGVFGFIPPPLEDGQALNMDKKQLLSIKLEVLVEHPALEPTKLLSKYVPPPPPTDNIGFDHLYLINLARRAERRERMLKSFSLLGLKVEVFEAVDGKRLNDSYLKGLGVKQMAGYKDPWSKRNMTLGEIGCFLSHYFIWVDIVKNGYEKVLVFEDDIRFEPYFKEKVEVMREEADELLEWDLIYLGRKKMKTADEPWVENSDTLVHVDYSYWTLCYAITLRGAKKLLSANPLRQLVPVDEYLPIMFNKHPEAEWMDKFPVRNLNAYSVAPLYVFPTHYTGEEGYFSDTEESPIIEEEDLNQPITEEEDLNQPITEEEDLNQPIMSSLGAGKGLEFEMSLNRIGKDEL